MLSGWQGALLAHGRLATDLAVHCGVQLTRLHSRDLRFEMIWRWGCLDMSVHDSLELCTTASLWSMLDYMVVQYWCDVGT